MKLLAHVGTLLEENMYVVNNIDATIIAQKPKMMPHIEHMVKNVAEVLHLEENQVNIKATTEEGLGFTGTGEGISAQAVCALTDARILWWMTAQAEAAAGAARDSNKQQERIGKQ